MARELSTKLHECVTQIATKKTVTEYSRPWISAEVSSQLKHLRRLRRKYRLRRSPRNKTELSKAQEETIHIIQKAEQEWWLLECSRLSNVSEAAKWNIINKLTNQSKFSGIKPIRKVINGQNVFLFEDEEIRSEMEEYHIRKGHSQDITVTAQQNEIYPDIDNVGKSVLNERMDSVLNGVILDREVKNTFGKGTDTPGPDGISASMLDKADRELMHSCLMLLWNEAWLSGRFINEWKEENRVVIPKPSREDYHDCSAYRTISITSCLGKRFEHITSQRLISVLTEVNFDKDQFAYLKNRSSTHAILTLVENIKKGLICGESAGAVFFDLTDAFGSVNRSHLLNKISSHFGTSGYLLQHISSFLQNRIARIKIDDTVGEWIQSEYGTSAGTRLGPLLFIIHLHDIPKCIKPKFADDLVVFAVGKDICEIQRSLQEATDQLVKWTTKEGMTINAAKTKVMLFGDRSDIIDIRIHDKTIENVRSYKYLGVILDPMLDFGWQVDYAIGKAKKEHSKVCTLINGRQGILVQLGIQLHKTLVRTQLEYAMPAWASISEKDQEKLDKLQVQCLRRIIGAKAHSSSSSVEVICGTVPV